MQLPPTYIFLHNPTASSIRVEGGNVYIRGDKGSGTSQPIAAASIQAGGCYSVCAKPCVDTVWTVTFNNVDFGDCNSCTKRLSIQIRRNRPRVAEADDMSQWGTGQMLHYEPRANGVATGTAIATEIERLYNTDNRGLAHDNFGGTVTRNGATLTFTYPCPMDMQIHPFDYSGLLAAEQPVITQTVPMELAILTNDMIQRMYPRNAFSNHPFQRENRAYFSDCENACTITLKGCLNNGCDVQWWGNLGNSSAAIEPFEVVLIVNGSATGYSAFTAALAAAITSCAGQLANRPLVNGSQLFNKTANTGVSTFVQENVETNWAQVSAANPGYTGAARISFTSTAAPATNASLVVPASIAQSGAQLALAFQSAGFPQITNPSGANIRFTTGQTNDAVTITYTVP
jgi:hypothetical protein